MNSEIPINESVDVHEFAALVESFDGHQASVFHGYEDVRRFAQDLVAEGQATIRVAELLEFAKGYTVKGSPAIAGDEKPLRKLAEMFQEQWATLLDKMPEGDRLHALIVLCGAGGLYGGALNAPVFAMLALGVLTLRGATKLVT